MSTLVFSVGMLAPYVYLSIWFYERYGYSKKHCNVFHTASYAAVGLIVLLSIILKLSVEFAALSCLVLLACCYIGRLCFRNKEALSDYENAVSAWISLIARSCMVVLLLCIGFFRQKLLDTLLGQGLYSIVYCAMWVLVIALTTLMDVKDISHSMRKQQ